MAIVMGRDQHRAQIGADVWPARRLVLARGRTMSAAWKGVPARRASIELHPRRR
jgi:hypothetical protein